ncbi:MAG: DNA recombination protein RmuC [Vampirovibrionales bacterium]
MNWIFLLSGVAFGALVSYLIFQAQANRRITTIQTQANEKDLHVVRLEEQRQHLQNELATSKEQAQQYYDDLSLKQDALASEKEANASLKSQVDSWEARFSESKKEWEKLWKENLQQFLSHELTQTREQLNKLAQVEDEERHQRFTGLVDPVKKMLDEYQAKLDVMNTAYATQIGIVNNNVDKLTSAKNQLLAVLKHNKGAGDWGEIQLNMILEASGLQKDTHYFTQKKLEGSKGIPDVVVKMEQERYVVIDCKTLRFSSKPLNDFEQDDAEAPTEAGFTDAKALVASIRQAVKSLNMKDYLQNNTKQTPDFVVMFLPQESMLSHALDEDKDLWQFAWERGVVLSSPLTLIALLRMIHMGWSQYNFTQNMEEVKKIGIELHERLVRMAKSLQAVDEKYKHLGDALQDVKTKHDGQQGLVKSLRKLESIGVKSSAVLPKELTTSEDDTPLLLETVEI